MTASRAAGDRGPPEGMIRTPSAWERNSFPTVLRSAAGGRDKFIRGYIRPIQQ